MAKYENIRALAKKQLQAVTESSDRWKAFLQTAAIAYNYSFPNQLLIHEQSPTATAVADIAYWNNNAGRWVKRGAHGIAVFDTRANSSRLRYLFDISDTIPRAEVPEALPWVITDQNWRPVWDKIVADNHADSIQSALLMLSTSCVAQRSAMFTTALGKAIDGSSLQWAKPDEQRQQFLQLITQSCLYMAALRCGVDTARLDLSALESVNQFDTNRITLCLGSACQQAARPLMQQIGSITREIDSVARAEKVRYYGDKQEETNNTKEVNNGVHDGERLPNPGADAERAADAGDRQVRQPAAKIPAGERADGVRRDDAGGNAVSASGGDGQRSTPANRTDDADADAAEHRPEPADRPDGLDAVDERLAGPSRGTGDAADLQPVTQEPQAESDTTPSAFSVPISDLPPLSDELILGLLAKDSSSRADNAAILEYFNEHPDLAERSAFCKHCYKQIYTYLFVDDHTVGFIRHDMYLELWEGNYLTKTAQVNLTWDAVAAKIADLIEQGRLMVPIKATPVQQQMEQLTLTPEDSEKAGLPSHEQQAKSIDLAAEVKKWNKPIIDASGKYITEQDITDALCKGGGFEDSKFRIQQYLSAQVLPIEEDQARWLKKEYGIGGGTWIFRDGGHGFLDHMGKNLEITRRTEDGEYRRVLKWKEVAQRLRLLVYNDQYLTDAEKAPYQAWAAEQQAARAANDAALDHAKHAITDFCENEGLNEPNFSDLTRVEFAYSTTEDDEHEIQVYANLLRNEIRYEVDGNIVHIDYFHDNHELAAQGIENSAFSDFINTAEAEFEKHHPTTRKVEKSPVTIGSTVYLEDDRPFTVEEIGRENIHLRDESFPLVGRAVSHEEFARLLAANPKNAALSAPEVPSRQEQPEETAEPIVGEVIEEPSPFVAQVMADAERLSAEDEPYHREPITYEAPYLDNLPTAPREKFAANSAAIQKLKEIEQRVANGGSPAFEDEQRILAQYTGWGGLSDAFDPNKSAWSNEYSQLKAALSESEYEAARSSTLTAFYTPATVIHPIYRALERFGVKGGKILEPSMGTGAFLAHGHFGSSDAKFYGVELDSITGRISKQLYQKANIQVTGYENALLPDNYFDCAIGNVPFGNFQVNDPQYNRLHFPIHDYFFAKSIDKLRTGGIMAFITSSGTLDKKDDRARKYIAERCDLIGAVRLPNNAFKGSGTKIMTDVIFLQKRDTLRQQDEPWLHLAEDATGITMNRYFVEHPEMICGKMEIVSGPYGPTPTCQPIDPDAVDRFGKPLLETQIDTAMQHLTATLTKAEIPIQEESGEDTKYIDADPFVRNFSYTVKDDKIYYREGAVMRECNPNAASAERIRKLVELRDTTRALIDAQLQDLSDEEIHRLQAQLNRQYDAFRAKHGLINSRSAELSFRDDSSYYLLCSLENVDEKGNFISKSDMFTKRTIRSAQIPDHADTASDALALSIGERAKVDMPYMMHLTGKDEATLAKELAGVIFVEPFRKQEDGSPVYLNLNIIVIGGSGSGKTRFYVKPNALQLIGSYLFLDPKGELTRTLGRIMETKGISVTVLDLVHFQGHYNPMAYLETDEDAIKLAFAIVNNTKPKDAPSGGDKFWDDSSVLLISALILYLMYEAPASEQNFSTLMYMILNCQVSENEMVENPLMMLFGELERRDPQHPAVLQFKSFMLGAKKTLQSILISAAANLYMFNSRKFAEMTSRDEMFLPRMGLEQRALFIVLPDNDTTFNFIATMLYTQLFDQLFRLADSTPEYNGALPIHVRLMMDEFANVALPKNFKNILAVCRSRNISCDIILQNIAQLKSLFKDDWEGIIGNCDTLLYLGGNEYGTYEYLSKILGKETERTKSQSIGKGSRGSSSDSLQTAGRELCMPDEIRRMRDDECLLLMRSEDPVIDRKYNLLKHPNVKYTPDAGGEPYVIPPDYMGDAVTITMGAVAAATAPEITEEMYEQLDYLEKHPEENYYENEENFSQYDQGD